MIKATYNPITGISYTVIDIDPRTEEKNTISARVQELYKRTCNTHAKKLRRANNTKSK